MVKHTQTIRRLLPSALEGLKLTPSQTFTLNHKTYSVISSSAHLGLEHTVEEVNIGGSYSGRSTCNVNILGVKKFPTKILN